MVFIQRKGEGLEAEETHAMLAMNSCSLGPKSEQEAVYVARGLATFRLSVRKSACFDACSVGHCSFEHVRGRFRPGVLIAW